MTTLRERAFAGAASQDRLAKMVCEALAEHWAGLTKELDPGQL